MIQAKTKYAPRCLTPHSGHILLLLWIEKSIDKKELFLNFIRHSNNRLDFESFIAILDTAATRCLNEYIELYPTLSESITTDDLFSWYNEMKENYIN